MHEALLKRQGKPAGWFSHACAAGSDPSSGGLAPSDDREARLAELRRNAGLGRLTGIASEDGVPEAWNMSRFEKALRVQPSHEPCGERKGPVLPRMPALPDDAQAANAGGAGHNVD